MALATARRNIARLGDGALSYPVKAGVICIQTGLAILAGGYARPGRTGQGGDNATKAADAATYQAVGVFVEAAVGGAQDGDVQVRIEPGTWNFNNSAGTDALTLADVGKVCFIVDDETVARGSASQTRARAGVVQNVDSDGVWVTVGPAGYGRRTITVPFSIGQTDLLAGASAELASPVAGEIVGMTVIVQTAVTTGGPITAAVGVTAVDGLSCVVADGATKGTVIPDTPTAGHASRVVTAGSRIQVIPDASFNAAGAVNGFVEIAY